MKSIFALTILLFSFSVHAGNTAAPDIECELRLYNVDKDGQPALGWMSREFKVTSEGGKASLEGFKADARLSRTCAADGGPCSPDFDLIVKTSAGKVSTISSKNFPGIDPKKPKSKIRSMDSYDTSLRLDTVEASVRCIVYGQ